MKVSVKLVIITLTVLLWSELSFSIEYDFRKTKWGMSVEQVKSSEPLEVSREDSISLIYKTTVIGKDVYVAYIFADKQLVRARYVLAESHSNKTDFIADYIDFKDILKKKYGKPKKEETYWKNDLYKDDYSDWGTAISIGHLVYLSTWHTTESEINNILSGENYEISCIVEYSSKNLEELERKAKEKKALDDF